MFTLDWLQANLPWGAHDYSADFHANPQPHKHFAHALLHIQKACGKLADFVDGCDHAGRPVGYELDAFQKYAADIVICVIKMANEWPGGRIDLAKAVVARLADKFPGWSLRDGAP